MSAKKNKTMLKEIIAVCLLAALITAALVNISYMDKLSLEIISGIDETEKFGLSEQFDAAAERLNEVIRLWDKNRVYAGIFLRHPEIDSSYDCFYDIMAQLQQEEKDSLPALCEKLRYHIRCMADMERLSFSSIL